MKLVENGADITICNGIGIILAKSSEAYGICKPLYSFLSIYKHFDNG